eukprot:1156191-Pelagomonas_calceolata.AAC.11
MWWARLFKLLKWRAQGAKTVPILLLVPVGTVSDPSSTAGVAFQQANACSYSCCTTDKTTTPLVYFKLVLRAAQGSMEPFQTAARPAFKQAVLLRCKPA